jgi:hypothetical protein
MRNLSFLLFLTLFIKETTTSHVLFKRHTVNAIRDNGTLKKATIPSNLLWCGPNECQIIKKISISENNTFSCHDDVLLINFEYTAIFRNQTKTIQTSQGFIHKESNVITDQKQSSTSCKNIKK